MSKDIYYWLNYISSRNTDDKILSLWIHNSDLFFNRYMVIEDEVYLVIADKKSYKLHEYKKNQDKFKINFNKACELVEECPEKILFKFKNLELVKR